MRVSIVSKLKQHSALCALSVAALFGAASAPATFAQHDHHGAHAAHRAPKASAPAKRRPAKRKTAKRKPVNRRPARRATPKLTSTPTPTAAQTPAQAPSAAPSAAPASAPAALSTPSTTHDAHSGHGAHGVVQPATSPEVNESPVTEAQSASPASSPAAPGTPTPSATPDPHAGHMQTGGAKEPTEKKDEAEKPENVAPSAPAHSTHDGHTTGGGSVADGSSRTTVDVNDIMVMNGDEMGIRIGTSPTNYVPMGQMGSGTAWQPASTPTYMWHKRAGDWLLMFHGEAKIGVNSQGGPRGVTKFESQNWFMPMAYRRVGRGTLQLRGMFSFEPFTFSGAGSPQIFQTGESYRGEPLVDAQHPHDLLMELSAQYTMPVGERGTWFTYVGFPGEPALGPVAFMHRISASENPTAPLAHHFQDSSHISFGVFTTGFSYRWLKLEGSLFNGREPDEQRYGFDFNPWNSRSVRVTVAPNANWAFQYSYGLLRDVELLEPGDTRRQTASIQYNRPLARGNWATSLIWGRNREEHGDETFRLNGYTLESTLNFLRRNYVYTRLELVDRKELLGHDDLDRLGFDHHSHPQFRVGAYTFGAARDIWNTDKMSLAVGGDVTAYSKPEVLDAVYGRNPTSYKFFIRLRPARTSAHSGH